MRPLLLAAVLLLGAAPAPDPTVAYTLAPVVENGAITALAVTIRLRGDADGTSRIASPPSWAGEKHLAQWARDVSVEGANSVEAQPDNARLIHAAPGAALTVRYRIVSAFAGDPSVADSRQPMPVVRPGWFYAVGEALFARPDGPDDRAATFAWGGPAAIGFASDLEHDGGRTTLDGLNESIVIGGRDLHVATTGPADAPVRVARVGAYSFDGAAFDALALKVIATERAFWRDRRPGAFLVTMTPLASQPNHVSFSGTGRSDAFALWMDASQPIDPVAWLLAHEYFHSWNPRRLGRLRGPEARDYWFSEGLTDFYARRLMLRADLITPAEFVAGWNEVLARYAASPFRATPNATVAAKFWDDEAADLMQYQRGALLAVRWDGQLRARGGLDAVLRAHVAARRPASEAVPLFATTAARFGLDVRPDLAAHVERGAPLLLPAGSFGRCARVMTEDRPVFVRGWDPDATAAAGNVIAGLDPMSNAYAAGLRNGMKVLRRVEGKPEDSRVDYVLQVVDGTTERLIRFRPAGRATRPTQQIVLDEATFARTPDACRLALAG